MADLKTLVVVPHTHWDREWYLPFQDFRAQLVTAIDGLLELMETDPAYTHFSLDGQTVVLEDYLEVRPEQRERLLALIRSGRILIGPWYVLPDEFLVSGESLIRNLLRGERLTAAFGGERAPLGYLPDQFGHIAQMPQILRGAGLDTTALWRGVPPAIRQAEFEWQAPDGSQVFCVYLPHGYCNAASLPMAAADLKDRLRQVMHDLQPFQVTGHYLLMNGCDHLPLQEGLPEALAAAAAELGVKVVIGTLPQYIAAVRPQVAALPRHVGELRSPARAPMLVGCTSARISQKQRNHKLETLLTSYADPLTAWVRAAGGSEYPPNLIREAWKQLLLNQPHDSICGCSIDQVHREMETRYDWGEQIATRAVETAQTELGAIVDTTTLGGREGFVVYNPVGAPRTDLVAAPLTEVRESHAICVVDPQGRRLPVQTTVNDGRATLLFPADGLPAAGWSVYRLEAAGAAATLPGDLQATPDGLENDFYRLTLNADGSFTVLDKETGVIYPAVNQFVDGGDCGDEYTYCPPSRDELVTEPVPPKRLGLLTGKISARVVEAGPLRATLELALNYRVPAGLTADRSARSRELVDLPVTTRVSLTRGLKRIDFRTTVDNTASDHRFRVQFAAPYRISDVALETQYAVVRRDLDLAMGADWREQPAGAGPAKSFASIGDGATGLTLLNRGLPEHEALAGDNSATLALTLIRAVGWLSREDLSTRPHGHAGPGLPTPEAQCLGEYTFAYAMTSHRGDWQEAQVWQLAHAFNCPPLARPAATHVGTLPASGSFVAVSGEGVVLAAVKRAEDGDGLIVRIYNTTPRPTEATLRFGLPLQQATPVDLLEHPAGAALTRAADGAVTLSLPPWRITSVRCSF